MKGNLTLVRVGGYTVGPGWTALKKDLPRVSSGVGGGGGGVYMQEGSICRKFTGRGLMTTVAVGNSHS